MILLITYIPFQSTITWWRAPLRFDIEVSVSGFGVQIASAIQTPLNGPVEATLITARFGQLHRTPSSGVLVGAFPRFSISGPLDCQFGPP